MSTRKQPMIFETSTRGTIRQSIFDKEYNYYYEMLKDHKEITKKVNEILLPIQLFDKGEEASND